MLYVATTTAMAVRRKAFTSKGRRQPLAVADSLEEADDRLFPFTRLPPSQCRSLRTTNAIERLHEDSNRAAVSRHRCHVVLGAARLRSDQHAQG